MKVPSFSKTKEGNIQVVGTKTKDENIQVVELAVIELDPDHEKTKFLCFTVNKTWAIIILGCLVIGTGVPNAVSGKIIAVPMGDFSFFLGVFNSFMYIVVYFSILGIKVAGGFVSKESIKWVWTMGKNGNIIERLPPVKYLIIMGLLDGLGQLFDLLTRPHVSGPLIQLLPQGSLFYNMIVSTLILRDRFTFWQLWSVLVLIAGVIVTLTPQIGGNFGGEVIYIIIIIIYPVFSSISFVLKELLFRKKPDLDVFIVNSHNSLFQFLLQPLFIPITFLINPHQTAGQSLPVYLQGAFDCFGGITPTWAPQGADCSPDPWPYIIYIAINIVFNISILTFVKEASVVVTFLVIRALLPLSVIAFYINWPLLKATPFSPWHIGGLVVIMAALGLYRISSYYKTKHKLYCLSVDLPCIEKDRFLYKPLSHVSS